MTNSGCRSLDWERINSSTSMMEDLMGKLKEIEFNVSPFK